MEAHEKWFGVRCLFRHREGTYEERVTIWPASSFEEAIEKAEEEAREYVADIGTTYLDFAQAYGPVMTRDLEEAHSLEAGVEVFSLMRDSDLDPDAYIAAFFATGAERQRPVEGTD